MNLNSLAPIVFLSVFLLLAVLHVCDLAGGEVTISGMGDLLVGAATVIGATAAVLALKTWKKQIDAELAKRLGAVIYQYRSSLHRIRVPFLVADEGELASALSLSPEELLNYARRRRWSRSRVQLVEVKALLAEADLRWHDAASIAFEPVLAVEDKLLGLVDRYKSLLEKKRSKDEDNEFVDLKKLLEDDFNGDDMSREINASFDNITRFLRRHI